jgi:hypothetical protein
MSILSKQQAADSLRIFTVLFFAGVLINWVWPRGMSSAGQRIVAALATAIGGVIGIALIKHMRMKR